VTLDVPGTRAVRFLVASGRECTPEPPGSIPTRRERLGCWGEHPRLEGLGWRPSWLFPPTRSVKLTGRNGPVDCVIKGVGFTCCIQPLRCGAVPGGKGLKLSQNLTLT
jgi:hypothetical protein